jgi:hypothetical protein
MRAQAVMLTLLVGTACSRASKAPESAEPQQPPYFRLAVRAGTDSVVKLAQFAVGTIKGQPQTPRIQGPLVIVGSRYDRDRRNGGHIEVTMMVAIDRTVRDSITRIELSAWAVEVQPERTALGGTGRLPTMTTTSPTTVASIQQQPYRVTRDDTEHWRSVMVVLEALIQEGARLESPAPQPKPGN